MHSPKPGWHRLRPTAHGRIQRALITLAAVGAGLVVGPAGAWAMRAPRAGPQAAATAASTPPSADAAAGVLADTVSAQRQALELYRADERAVPQVGRVASRQSAMDAYRQAEIAVRASVGPTEHRRALELYRAAERTGADGRAAQRRGHDLYRRDEITARTSP